MSSLFSVRGSAQAKVILLGEHFVLPWEDSQGKFQPGSAAVALPVPNLCTEVILQSGEEISECSFSYEPHPDDSPDLDRSYLLSLMEKSCRMVAQAVSWDLERFPLRIYSQSRFPISRGFGSSASFSVALSRAFLKLMNQKEIWNMDGLVQKVENIFHGKSSGIDTAAVLSASPILFRDGKIVSTFTQNAVDFVILDSSPRDNSFLWIQKTIAFRNEYPTVWAAHSLKIHQHSLEMVDLLSQTDGIQGVSNAVREAQEILNSIGLVTPRMKDLLNYGLKMGATAGKMSGAGGGGAMIFVAHPGRGRRLADAFNQAGAHVLSTLYADTDLQLNRYLSL